MNYHDYDLQDIARVNHSLNISTPTINARNQVIQETLIPVASAYNVLEHFRTGADTDIEVTGKGTVRVIRRLTGNLLNLDSEIVIDVAGKHEDHLQELFGFAGLNVLAMRHKDDHGKLILAPRTAEPTVEVKVLYSESPALQPGLYGLEEFKAMANVARYSAPAGLAYDKTEVHLLINSVKVYHARLDIQNIEQPGDGNTDPVAHGVRAAKWVLSEKGRTFYATYHGPNSTEYAAECKEAAILLAQLRKVEA